MEDKEPIFSGRYGGTCSGLRARYLACCSQARHFTLTVPLPPRGRDGCRLPLAGGEFWINFCWVCPLFDIM